jgi:hypothetical protein
VFLRERSSRESRLYPPGVELSRVEGVSIRRYSPLESTLERGLAALGTRSWGPSSLPEIIAELESIPRRQVKQEESVPPGQFEMLAVSTGEDPGKLSRRARLALEDTFEIAWTREKELESVYVIRSLPGRQVSLKPGGMAVRGGFGFGNGKATVHFEGATLPDVAARLSDSLEFPFLDETRIPGVWDGELTWNPADPEGLRKAFRDKGLDLVLDVRDVDVIVVRRR